MRGRAPQRRDKPRRRGYRHAVLADARARPLIYADALSIIPAHPGGSLGLSGASFAPGVLEQVSRGLPTVQVHTANRLRLILQGVRISFHAGEQLRPEGGWHVQAAVGIYQRLRQP